MITDHRMILSISSQQTTLYDQIRYQGSPASFAWVLPISGEVKVGLSADVVFATLDSLSKVTVQSPNISCPQPPSCPSDHGAGAPSSFSDAGVAEPPVTVVKEETVGPYETVQLKADDPNALLDWLSAHNFVVPDDVKPIITAYTNEHFGFLAMKLVPGASVQAMRPVRVTMAGASPALPLRMVAAGTGATVGITLWVIGEGRYEPQNFPWFQIKASDLTWNFASESSDYASIRQQRETDLGGRGWQLESSIAAYPVGIQQLVRGGGVYYSDEPAEDDYDPVTADAGVVETAEQVRNDDLATLFAGMDGSSVRITRMRSDLAHAALATDLFLQASPDQSSIPTTLQVTQSVNAPPCPPTPPPPVCPGDPGSSGTFPGDPFAPSSPFKPGMGQTKPSNGKESFSCASVPGDTSGSGVALASIAGFFTVAMTRLRRSRRARRGAHIES